MSGQMELPAFRELTPETRAAQRTLLESCIARGPRRRAVLALALGVAVAAAAPTLAFQRDLVEFWSADPAPERIQLDFEFLREHSADMNARFGSPRITPEGSAREVMRVTLDGESRPLWVVPTTEGSFCYRLHFHGSCLVGEAARQPRIGAGGLATHSGHGFAWMVGSVRESAIRELVLVYQDGERVTLPYVWVSPPIHAGFYAYDVPEDREVAARLTAVILGLDEDGSEVARACLPLSPDATEASVPEVRELCPPRRTPSTPNRKADR